jgi:hypothetical protein
MSVAEAAIVQSVSRTSSTSSSALVRVCWSGERVRLGTMLGAGLLVWLAYSIAQVLVNGVVFDIVVVPAQIIAGAVRYPEGHPHGLYYPRLFSLQNYVAALQWMLVPSATLISAIGNVFFVLAATFVPFAATVALTRRPWWGHVATVLMLTETTTRFNGSYLMWIFPHFSSHGHLGLHFALLVPVLLAAGLWRLGMLSLVLLPVIHISMTAVVWPWAAFYFWWHRQRLTGQIRRQLTACALVGLAVCGAIGAIILLRADISLAPPYNPPADIDLIYRLFTETTDGHRQPIHVASFAYLANPLIFLTFGAWLILRSRRDDGEDVGAPASFAWWIYAFGVMVWAYIYGTRLFQAITGFLPDAVQMTMPSRLSNMSATLLMPLTVGVMAAAWERVDARGRTAVLAVLALLVTAAGALAAYDNYLAFSHVMYLVLGFAVAVDFHADMQAGRWPLRSVVTFAAFVAAFVFLYFAIGTLIVLPFAVSAVGCAVVLRLGPIAPVHGPEWQRRATAAVLAGCLVTAVTATRAEHIPNNWDAAEGRWYQESSFDRSLNQWLAEHGQANEMLLAALWPRSAFQVTTGHPVMIDIDTLMMVAYIRELAPAVNVLVRDVFEIDYSDEAQLRRIVDRDGMLRPIAPIWLEAWRNRSIEEWQRLGEKYRFRLVLAPSTTPLRMTPTLKGPVWTLYAIPPSASKSEGRDVEGT